ITANKAYTLAINAALAISAPASLPTGTVAAAYPSTTMTATGGTGPYTWSATGMPSGLSLNSTTRVLSGTPATATGSPFNVTITVKDSNSITVTKPYSLTIKR